MNRALFHVEPLVMHGKPFHYWAWLDRAASMARHLAAAGWEVRVATNAALAGRAVAPFEPHLAHQPVNGQSLPQAWLAAFSQEELRAPYGAPNIAILDGLHHGRWPRETVAAHARVVRERLAPFVPDLIVSWTPANALREAFPEALVLYTENGIFSRAPYPAFQFFDGQGLFEQSVPATAADELRARVPTQRERAFLDGWRAALRAQHRASSPFHALEAAMRERHPRLALLPLQFGGEAGFDLNGPFRNQGEFLLHVLERLPADVGLLVTEHPTAGWLGDGIDEETQVWLREACPQVVFVPAGAGAFAGQALVPHVDTVISLSSSIGWQALFWGRELVCPGGGHLAAWAHESDPARIGVAKPDVSPPDGALAWMLAHYFVRNARCLDDAAWLPPFFTGLLGRWRAGRRGLALHEPCEPLETLEAAVLEVAATAETMVEVAPDLVRNGEFRIVGTDGSPSDWALLPGLNSAVQLTVLAQPEGMPPGAGCAARLRRETQGVGPTLLLQRIGDASRLAGAQVMVTFEARGTAGCHLSCYLYQQLGAGGGASRGTAARAYALGAKWKRFTYLATVPPLADATLGEGHHTELVFLLPPAPEQVTVEIANVTLGPANWQVLAA